MPYNMRRSCFSSETLVDLPVGEIVDVHLAQTGEGIAECELLSWFVHEVSKYTSLTIGLYHLGSNFFFSWAL